MQTHYGNSRHEENVGWVVAGRDSIYIRDTYGKRRKQKQYGIMRRCAVSLAFLCAILALHTANGRVESYFKEENTLIVFDRSGRKTVAQQRVSRALLDASTNAERRARGRIQDHGDLAYPTLVMFSNDAKSKNCGEMTSKQVFRYTCKRRWDNFLDTDPTWGLYENSM